MILMGESGLEAVKWTYDAQMDGETDRAAAVEAPVEDLPWLKTRRRLRKGIAQAETTAWAR